MALKHKNKKFLQPLLPILVNDMQIMAKAEKKTHTPKKIQIQELEHKILSIHRHHRSYRLRWVRL